VHVLEYHQHGPSRGQPFDELQWRFERPRLADRRRPIESRIAGFARDVGSPSVRRVPAAFCMYRLESKEPNRSRMSTAERCRWRRRVGLPLPELAAKLNSALD
jgi:hypothetical protein